MAKPETTSCWYKKSYNTAWKRGKFHCWGLEPGMSEGDGSYSIAIIEGDSGAIVTITPERVHFGSDPARHD